MDFAQPFLPHHQKRIFQPPKISIPQTQTHRRQWTSATLRISPNLNKPCDSMNEKTQLHYHKLSHTSNVMLQTEQAEHLI